MVVNDDTLSLLNGQIVLSFQEKIRFKKAMPRSADNTFEASNHKNIKRSNAMAGSYHILCLEYGQLLQFSKQILNKAIIYSIKILSKKIIH